MPVVIQPPPALWALLISYGAVPALAWLVGPLVTEPDYRIGLLIVASVPCTLASAVLWTRMAGGSEATALLVILLTTSTSWLATTAWLMRTTGTAVGVDAAAMMRELLVVLVAPVALGQLARTAPPLAQLAQRGRTVLGVLSRLLILSIILKAATDASGQLAARAELPAPGLLLGTAGLCLGLHLTALTAGLWSSKALRFDRPSQIAVAFACSQKALPVSLLLFETYFKDAYPLAVVPIVLYPVGQLVMDTFIAQILSPSERAMGESAMNRTDAFALLNEYVKDQSLVRHMLAVEAAMRAYARKLGQDEERWGIVGLLHDFDYERWPNPPDHPLQGAEILRQHGYPEDVIYAIKSHADYLPDCPRVHLMDKALYACDELAGLITATAILRPGGITDLTASSVKKKMKSKGFARSINREDIERGAADFGVDLVEHIQFEIDAMKPIAAKLGLERGAGGEGEGPSV